MEITIKYGNADVNVSHEVSDFLETDRKRQSAEERSDRRHISRIDFEQKPIATKVPFHSDPVFDEVNKKMTLEKLNNIVSSLKPDEQELLKLYFYEQKSMREIGVLMGNVSKMAISKRLNKLLSKMRNLM
ncbi:MAG: sigma-70 family RNA polymerase sigma factor [Clostridia bacterium]